MDILFKIANFYRKFLLLGSVAVQC